MAIGKARVSDLDTDKITLWLDNLVVAEGGRISTEYSEEKGAAVLAQDEFSVRVNLGRGEANATIWTTDLSHEYIRINAEYRS
jgi:N-acetylglutamate synthase (N-acetylornithine aminotransferase)